MKPKPKPKPEDRDGFAIWRSFADDSWGWDVDVFTTSRSMDAECKRRLKQLAAFRVAEIKSHGDYSARIVPVRVVRRAR